MESYETERERERDRELPCIYREKDLVEVLRAWGREVKAKYKSICLNPIKNHTYGLDKTVTFTIVFVH